MATSSKLLIFISCLLVFASTCVGEQTSHSTLSFELTCVDPEATGFATFQSHNQKVVANQRGYFMTHIRTRNEAYTAQQWRLSWSQDQGRSFATIYEATHATNPPVLETDSRNNIYLVRSDFVDGHAYLYRFLAEDDYRQPRISKIPQGAAGKYSMVIDEQRERLYYFAHNNSFHRIRLDGTIESSTTLLRSGENAILQYPLLYLDAQQTLHAAWTTQKHGVYLYWDIQTMQSADGGASWKTMRGDTVEIPAAADENGVTDRISLDDEFEAHTWLSSFCVSGGKSHFLYLAQTQPPRQHYVRYDLQTAQRELDVQPALRGNSLAITNLDGFFVRSNHPDDKTIFVISRDATKPRLVCLASDDNGTTWHDHAVSDLVKIPYSIGGYRAVTADGCLIGSFTEQSGLTTESDGKSKVYFFRVRGER